MQDNNFYPIHAQLEEVAKYAKHTISKDKFVQDVTERVIRERLLSENTAMYTTLSRLARIIQFNLTEAKTQRELTLDTYLLNIQNYCIAYIYAHKILKTPNISTFYVPFKSVLSLIQGRTEATKDNILLSEYLCVCVMLHEFCLIMSQDYSECFTLDDARQVLVRVATKRLRAIFGYNCILSDLFSDLFGALKKHFADGEVKMPEILAITEQHLIQFMKKACYTVYSEHADGIAYDTSH